MKFARSLTPLISLALALAAPAAAVGQPQLLAAAAPVSVQGVSWDADRQAWIVRTSGGVQPRVQRLDGPSRLVVDLPGTKLVPAYQALEGQPGSGVTRVRVGQFQAGTTRVVLDLARPLQFDVSAGDGEVVIPLGKPITGAAPAVAAATPQSRPIIRWIRHDRGAFSFAMSRRAPYWSHVQPGNGEHVRYKVVFPNVRLAPSAQGSVAIEANGIHRYTASQRGDDAHIEFELSKPPTFDVSATGHGWRFAVDRDMAGAPGGRPTTVAKQPTPRPRRGKIETPAGARPVAVKPDTPAAGWHGAPDAPLALRKVDGHWQMLLTADERFRYRTAVVGDDRIRVDIEGARVSLPRDSVYIDNGLIARVRVNSVQGGTTRLTIDLDQPVRHTHRLLGNQRSLLLGFHRVGKDRVTLDPGHGGSDNGTTGVKGTREKDVTLAIATRLARMMEANGMSVQMTRMKDLEILLRPRVEMANRNDSDVFVSIHANSFGSQHGVNGIETYYFSDESYPLARSIHRSLLRSLGRPDRGVRKNNFYVVHHTRMPAALIEIGYLSNPEEEALLASPAYQEKAAQAIYAGIRDFLASRKQTH